MTLGGSSRTKDLIRRFDALSAVHDAAKRPLWLREAGSVGVGRKHNPPEPATTTAAMHGGQLLTAATTVAPGLSTENGGGSDNHNSSNFTISQLPAAAPTAAPRATPAAPATADSNGIDGDMSDIGVNEDIALQLMSPAVHKSSQFASDAGVDQSTQKQRTRTIPELAEAAKIDTQKIQASSKAWLATAQSCYDRARICQINDELEDAFIYYMKFTTIIMEIVPRQGDYKSIKLSPKMKELRSLLSTEVMTSMEKIKSELKQRPIAAPVEEMPEPRSPASRSVQGEIDDFNQRYPEAPPTPPVVSDPAIPQAQVHDTYSSFHHRFSEIDNQARQISKDTETLKSLITHTNTGADALPSGTASSGPHYNLPVTCTPESLREWLLHIQKAELTNEPILFTLLILDVRSNNEFVWGHIKTNNIVNIDPIGLREGCTSAQIENSLVLESETSQELFRNRNKFDIIVYMDANSESLHPQSSKHQQQAKILRTL
ncbi:ubiquitin-specific protease doa4, partial [Spiromyces aspiralis]